jgi:hypothetical protein
MWRSGKFALAMQGVAIAIISINVAKKTQNYAKKITAQLCVCVCVCEEERRSVYNVNRLLGLFGFISNIDDIVFAFKLVLLCFALYMCASGPPQFSFVMCHSISCMHRGIDV